MLPNDVNLERLLGAMVSGSAADASLVSHAYKFALKAHEGQKRFSGEPYFVHAFHTALILAELKQDAATISAGLLHDTIEDTLVDAKTFEREFGKEITFLVDGVTKLGHLKYQKNNVERRTESLRKLFIAMAKDIRVLVIKLADRLHNIRTLEHHRNIEKRQRIAFETLEVHARLAERFGMWKLKEELEDAAFSHAYPQSYERVTKMLSERIRLDDERLDKMTQLLREVVDNRSIKDVEVTHRRKALYSTYRKLLEKEMDLNKIYDLSALRVVVPTVEDCYRVLGIVHGLWTPIPGRVKDYISTPKRNGYQSIHTDVFARDKVPVEIQLRTKEMHMEAEFGIASHLAYSESGKQQEGGKLPRALRWVQQLLDWQRQVAESDKDEFMENLKLDFFKNQIFVFTPKGDVIELPEGATVLDFAYAVHSEVGNHAIGAWVSKKYAGLDSALVSGDVVEVNTRKSSRPTYGWLKFVKTTYAKKKIRATLITEV